MTVERSDPTHARDPGDEPPPEVSAELLWRVAVRLHRDHGRSVVDEYDDEGRPRCRGCGQPWPCSGRRLAELGLIAAVG